MFHIRPATPADCAGIAKVQVDSYCTAYAGFFPESYFQNFSYAEQEQDWLNWFASGTDEILLVAVSPENEVIGYALTRAKAEIYPGYDSELAALHVRKALQGQGIGKALILNTAERLAARGCQTVMLWTLQGNPVRRWYESLHGKLLGETNYDVDGWNIVEVAYGWEIRQFAKL
jgi:ribosomal protein S18 acetylase RimI-like enzyme